MKKLFVLFAFLLIPFSASALEVPAVPDSYILDQAEMLSDSFEQELYQKLETLDKETTGQVAVLTIPTLDGEVIEEYALEVFRGWGIGQEEDNNGLLLLIALENREMRIEVGYGLEGRVTDAMASSIIRNTLVPAFQTEDYEAGVDAAMGEIVDAIYQEAEEYGFQTLHEDGGAFVQLGPKSILMQLFDGVFLALFPFILLVIVYSYRGGKKSKKALEKPIPQLLTLILLITGGFYFWTWLSAIAGSQLFYYALKKLDYDKKGKGGRGGRKGPWISTGGFGGGGSSGGGSSFGGFGGGSSGGGGASGKW
jgi:uncharacterized protein